jgi:DNA-binding CsgD family transcriptional regulator
VPQGFMRDVLRRRVHGGDRIVVLEVTTGQQALSRGDLTALGEAFGLTLAEISILALLGQGQSLAEIASTRGVEIDTVRGQCKLLLSKTRSRRQSDLVKLVVALCAQDAAATY